jgi:hypothetical protein
VLFWLVGELHVLILVLILILVLVLVLVLILVLILILVLVLVLVLILVLILAARSWRRGVRPETLPLASTTSAGAGISAEGPLGSPAWIAGRPSRLTLAL